ncbi:MAG: hypothetical protein AMXMBFR47_41110 [Planctomycetota bacterium]
MRGILRFFALLNRPCHGMSELISRDLDEPLGWPERAAYRFHTLYCNSCRRFRSQVAALRDALRAAQSRWLTVEPPRSLRLSAEARERISGNLP